VVETLPAAWSQGAAAAMVQTPPSSPAVATPAASRETRECFRAKWFVVLWRRVVTLCSEDVDADTPDLSVDMREVTLLIRGNKS
jgi:hypothetical protein